MCSNLQKQLSQNRNRLWTAGAVSAVHVESNVQPNITANLETVIDPIPEPPPIPENIIEETISQLNALGEPTLASIGLGGNTPVGLVQCAFEFLHANMGLEWWAAIGVGKNNLFYHIFSRKNNIVSVNIINLYI